MPDSEFTPTVDQAKRAYVTGMRQAFIASAGEHGAEFDRFIAAHDREVAAKTLREAADHLNEKFQDIPAWGEAYQEGVRTDEWMRGGSRMVVSAIDVIRSRAARIEQGGAGQ